MTLRRRGFVHLRCRELSLQVDEIAAQQTRHALDARRQLGVERRRDQVGLTCDGELCLESEQLALRGSIQLSLLGGRIPTVPVRNEPSRIERGEHELVGNDLGLASRVLACGADDIGGEGDGLLPDFEIANIGSHGPKMAAKSQITGTE
jgi:hypothetical protein